MNKKKLSPRLIRLGRKITHWLSVIVIGIALGLTLQFVRAWTEPSQAPPGGNLGAPINTSATVQTKSGGLNVSGKIKVGNDAQPQVAGQIRWSGLDFEGFDGTTWKSFTAIGGGGTPGHLQYNCPNLGGEGMCWDSNRCWGQIGNDPTCAYYEYIGDCNSQPGGASPDCPSGSVCKYRGTQPCYAIMVP